MSILKTIQKKGIEYQEHLDSIYRKRNGIYYTGLKLCNILMKELVPHVIKNEKFLFLEPCVGIGNYVFTYLYQLNKYNLSINQKKEIINSIYVCDINKQSLKIFLKLFKEFVAYFWKLDLPNDWARIHVSSTGCIFNHEISEDYLPLPFDMRFDVVATNPPYLMLKMDSNSISDPEIYKQHNELNKVIGKMIDKNFVYQNGVPNLYRLFVEDIVKQYSTRGSLISLLIPFSFLNEDSSKRLRKFILDKTNILSIRVFGEDNPEILASCAMCSILCQKGSSTVKTPIVYNCMEEDEVQKIYSRKLYLGTGGIVGFSEKGLKKLEQLLRFPKIKDLDFLTVCRGELDIWENKQYLTDNPQDTPLVRGRNITDYKIIEITDYVSSKFLPSAKKFEHFQENRIGCKVIANQNIKKRVKWAFIPANYICGNTINYLSIKKKGSIDYYTLLAILNSSVINSYFKLMSTNNHVDIFMIKEFPIPLGSKYLNGISELVGKYMKNNDVKLYKEIDHLVKCAYFK